MSVPVDPRPPGLGPFEIGAELRRGPAFLLERARDLRFDRPVVLKRALDRAENGPLRDRLARQGRFSGPRVVPVHDLLEDPDGRVVGVLEEVAGCDLLRWFRAEGREPDLALLVDLVRQVLAALEEIHRAGGAHGLLEPEHVLVGALDGRPLVRLTSFAPEAEADSRADLAAAAALFGLFGPADGLPAELADVVAAAAAGEFQNAAVFRDALRPGELGHWTRKVLVGEVASGTRPGDEAPEPRLDETLVALVDGARRLLDEEDYELAGDLLHEVLARRPDHAEAVRLLHRAETALEERMRASADGSPEASPDPERAALRAEVETELAERRPAAAAAALDRLLRDGGADEDLSMWRLRLCGLWVEEAEELLGSGSLEEARSSLGEAQRLAPGSTEVQRVSELLEDARDRYRTEERVRARGEALAEICHLLDGDRLRDAWEVHQTVRARLGNWKELEALAVELAELLVAEAQWSAARGRIDDAADLLRRATVVAPANPHARSLLAATEAALSVERQKRRVETLLRQAVSSIEEMLARGDRDGARAALEFARERFGDSGALGELEERLAV